MKLENVDVVVALRGQMCTLESELQQVVDVHECWRKGACARLLEIHFNGRHCELPIDTDDVATEIFKAVYDAYTRRIDAIKASLAAI